MMKKRLISKTILILFLCSGAFAQSSKDISAENERTTDEVQLIVDEGEYEEEASETYDEASDEYEEADTGTKVAPKKKSSFLSDLTTFGNKGKYIYTDESSCYSKNLTGQLKQFSAQIIIDPENANAGFMAKNQGIYYMIFMDKANRKLLKKSMEKYLSDFSNKKLDRKYKKSYRAYDKLKITLRWGTVKTSTPNNGTGNANCGYEFVGKSPYFTITVPELYNKFSEDSSAANLSSQHIKYYFTKAQISAIVEMLEEDKINDAISQYILDEYGIQQEADEY